MADNKSNTRREYTCVTRKPLGGSPYKEVKEKGTGKTVGKITHHKDVYGNEWDEFKPSKK